MPEMLFSVRWPDGTRMACQSPSTIIGRHLPPNVYTLADFLARARSGFAAASERVREVYGFPCSRAALQLRAIEQAARQFWEQPDALVTVEAE
jgi:uncharacterized repeat protein (TIGR04042 family)